MAIVSLYHHCLSWLALCHHPGTWNLFGVTCHRWGAQGIASSRVGIQHPAMMLSDGPRKDIRSLCWQLVKGLDVCHATWQHRFVRHWWEIFKLSLQESTLSYSDINTCMCNIYIHVNIYIYNLYNIIYIYILYPYIFTYIHKRSEKHLSFLAVWEIEQTSLSFSRIGNDQVFFDLWGQANHS